MHGEMHLRPWEIRRMTLQEVALALEEPTPGKKRPPNGAPDLGPYGVIEHVRRLRAMTPAERLDAALGDN